MFQQLLNSFVVRVTFYLSSLMDIVYCRNKCHQAAHRILYIKSCSRYGNETVCPWIRTAPDSCQLRESDLRLDRFCERSDRESSRNGTEIQLRNTLREIVWSKRGGGSNSILIMWSFQHGTVSLVDGGILSNIPVWFKLYNYVYCIWTYLNKIWTKQLLSTSYQVRPPSNFPLLILFLKLF